MAIAFPFWAGLGLVLFTGLFNIGIIGLDDYNNGFDVLIPAQTPPPFSELTGGVHPLLPKLALLGISQTIYGLGATDPVWQLRLALAFIGVCIFLAVFCSARHLFAKSPFEQKVAYFFCAFYFAGPIFYTRPMIETLCLPFLTWSGVWASDYARTGERKALAFSLVALTLSSLIRFQTGICWLALLSLVLVRRRWSDGFFLLVLSAGLFGVSGIGDLFVSGQFHGQLRAYLGYNLAFSGEHYGRMPFYTFLVLAFALTLPPAFVSLYRGFDWKRVYGPLAAPLLFVFFFILAHSASPHKEDRFFVPILPLFLFCLVPLAAWLWQEGAVWRRAWFLGLNSVLLFLACTNIAQNNVIGLARWLAEKPQIASVDSLDVSLVFYPQAFIARSLEWTNNQSWQNYQSTDCSRVAVLRSGTVPDESWQKRYVAVATFNPGWIEKLLVQTNPKNARRGPLTAYRPAHCEK